MASKNSSNGNKQQTAGAPVETASADAQQPEGSEQQTHLVQVLNRNLHQPEQIGQFRFLQVRLSDENVSVSEPMPAAEAARLCSLDGFSRYQPNKETEAAIDEAVRQLRDEKDSRDEQDRIAQAHSDEVATMQASNLALAGEIRRLTLHRDDLIGENARLRKELARYRHLEVVEPQAPEEGA